MTAETAEKVRPAIETLLSLLRSEDVRRYLLMVRLAKIFLQHSRQSARRDPKLAGNFILSGRIGGIDRFGDFFDEVVGAEKR